jgi:hypothetical protein
VSRRRTTFGKLQRDRDKQAKAQAQLAELHAAFDDGKMGLEDFETRRDELTSQLRVD